MTGKQRLPSLSQVPTTAEAGYPKVNATSWFALFAPAATPNRWSTSWYADVRCRGAECSLPAKAQEQGATAEYLSPQQLGEQVRADLGNWAQVVKASHIEAE